MAKTLQYSTSPEDAGRLMAHLVDHLANYSQYFEVEQRGPSLIALRTREVIARQWQFQKSGFLVRVTGDRGGSRITLLRTLGPLANWFWGLFTAGWAAALVWGLWRMGAQPAEARGAVTWVATAGGLTLFGLGMRQVFYWTTAGRDRELTNILQKAIADFGRPTAIRRREASRGPGTP